jgi:hypothetical protein
MGKSSGVRVFGANVRLLPEKPPEGWRQGSSQCEHISIFSDFVCEHEHMQRRVLPTISRTRKGNQMEA